MLWLSEALVFGRVRERFYATTSAGLRRYCAPFSFDESDDNGQRHGGLAYNDALQASRAEHVPLVYPRAGAEAIVSVGRHNMVGHRAPSTIETLLRFGAIVYRTDENAAVIITTDGRRRL